MNNIKIYKTHFVPYEGIYMTCGEEWPSNQELDEEEFVKLSEYQNLFNRYIELQYIMDGLEK